MMNFGPKRSHFLSIFQHGFRNFGLLILLLGFCLFTGKWSLLFDNVALLATVLVMPLSQIFTYLFTYYSIDNEKLYIKKGIMNRKNIEISLDKITTIDMSQKLLYQLANVYNININTGASLTNAMSNELSISFKKEDALAFQQLLLNSKKANQNETFSLNEKKATTTELIVMALMNSNIFFMFQLVFFLSLFLPSFFDNIADFAISYFINNGSIYMIIQVFIAIYILSSMFNLLTIFVMYYNFSIKDCGESLSIKYGIFDKKNHTLLKNKISGINYKQSFIMKLFGFGVLEVFAVGYDLDESKSHLSIIFPFLRKRELKDFLNQFITNIYFDEKQIKPPLKSLRYFFLNWKILFSTIFISAIVTLYYFDIFDYSKFKYYFVFLAIFASVSFIGSIISSILEYTNTGLSQNDNYIFISSGGFKKNNIFIKKSMIEYIQSSGSLLKRRHGISSLTFGIWADLANMAHRVKNLPLETFSDIDIITK